MLPAFTFMSQRKGQYRDNSGDATPESGVAREKESERKRSGLRGWGGGDQEVKSFSVANFAGLPCFFFCSMA